MPRAIVALGGNTLLRSGEGTVAEQRERMRETRENLRPLRERDYDVVFTHGNGPQVGNRLLAEEESSGPAEPLDVVGAETQAQVGYLLQGAFGDAFGPDPAVVITRTRVDPDDPAFEDPTKPIGPYYTESEVTEQPFETTEVHRDGGTAYRRVVPSPRPTSVLEIDRIRTLVRDDAGPVICGGGGGVPVVAADDGDGAGENSDTTCFEGVPAVIDKDHTSRLVAEAVDADELLLLTDVDAAYLDYGTEDQRPIGATTPSELRAHLDAGEFAAGSMQPKIEACVDFVEAVGGRAILTSPARLGDALRDEAGTRVTHAE
ncbi:carbamate kinase [Haloparvum sp. PAK95]|uniref:amino acid kinase family protein n=1 Tax=Haloparvum sp. PAK95 TaxID=3418962 RepID=UPI003D2EA163